MHFAFPESRGWMPRGLRWPKGPIQLCWSSINETTYKCPSLCYGKANCRQIKTNFFSKPRKDSPLGPGSIPQVCVGQEAPTPTTGTAGSLFCPRQGGRRGSQSLCCSSCQSCPQCFFCFLLLPTAPSSCFLQINCLPPFSCALSFRSRGTV